MILCLSERSGVTRKEHMTASRQGILGIMCWIVLSFSPAFADESAPALPWQVGPTEAKLGDQARLKVPQGYRFLGALETQRLLKQMGNFPSGSELGLITSAAGAEQWFMIPVMTGRKNVKKAKQTRA